MPRYINRLPLSFTAPKPTAEEMVKAGLKAPEPKVEMPAVAVERY